MKLPVCVYNQNRDIQMMWDQVRTWSEGRVDGWNMSEELFGAGFEWQYPPSPDPPYVNISLLDPKQDAFIEKKGKGGLQFITNPTEIDGQVCFVSKTEPETQVLSVRVDDPKGVPDPGASITANFGNLLLRSGLTTRINLGIDGVTRYYEDHDVSFGIFRHKRGSFAARGPMKAGQFYMSTGA